MPLMGVVAMIVGEAAELLADHGQGIVVERRVAEFAVGDEFGETHQHGIAGAVACQGRHGRIGGKGRGFSLHVEIGRPQDFALAHRQAAGHLREIFGERRLADQRFALAEPAAVARAAAPSPGSRAAR